MSAPLKIYGRITSINVQKVVFAAEEAGLAYERIEAGGKFGVADTPEYRKLNPNGLIPTIVEADGFVLWESNAIVRYLAARYSEDALYPSDHKQRALADRWMDWQTTTMLPAMRAGFTELVRKPAGAPRDEAAVEQSRVRCGDLAGILDAALAGNTYLAGEAFTMAEIAVAPVVHRWLHIPWERPHLPHLERWYAQVSQRPSAAVAMPLPIA